MLIIRRITENDQTSFLEFCNRLGTKELLKNNKVFFGVFNNEELQGYTKMDFHFLSFPLIEEFHTLKGLEPSIIEGLLRGTLHYCLTKDYETVGIRKSLWLESHLIEILEIIEKTDYNKKDYYQLNIQQFFNKPCKGRSICQ
jgi:hypothetical protein